MVSHKEIGNWYIGPWLLGGDFNNITCQSEKWRGRQFNPSRATKFINCINHYGLLDLGFKGSKYTWSNHHR